MFIDIGLRSTAQSGAVVHVVALGKRDRERKGKKTRRGGRKKGKESKKGREGEREGEQEGEHEGEHEREGGANKAPCWLLRGAICMTVMVDCGY